MKSTFLAVFLLFMGSLLYAANPSVTMHIESFAPKGGKIYAIWRAEVVDLQGGKTRQAVLSNADGVIETKNFKPKNGKAVIHFSSRAAWLYPEDRGTQYNTQIKLDDVVETSTFNIY